MQKDTPPWNTGPLFKNNVKEIKPYSVKEICDIYYISTKTFVNWIKPFLDDIGPKRGRYYNVNQVKIIFKRLGLPESMEE
ncbi:MAG TPA: hypothetical protein VK489_10475 [Ferruginibacter sp.]|nr:hypothetical protein [Ferruginibacter sp.]